MNKKYILIYSETTLPFDHICDDYYCVPEGEITDGTALEAAQIVGVVSHADIKKLKNFDKQHDTLVLGEIYKDAFSIFEPDDLELTAKTKNSYVFLNKDRKYIIKVAKNKCKVLPLLNNNLKP